MPRTLRRSRALLTLLLLLLFAAGAKRGLVMTARSDSIRRPQPDDRGTDVCEVVEQSRQQLAELQVRLRPIVTDEPTAPAEQTVTQEEPTAVSHPAPGSRVPAPHTFTRHPELELAGRTLVEHEEGGIGAFPTISADYRRHVGFERYVREIQRVGGRFFVYDQAAGRIRSEVDPLASCLLPTSGLEGLSPRSRRIRNEPELSGVLAEAQSEFGRSASRIILLLPLGLDTYLIGGLDRALHEAGLAMSDFAEFRGVYLLEQGRLVLRVDSGILKVGGTRGFTLRFEL